MKLKLAAARYRIGMPDDFADFAAGLEVRVCDAVRLGAQLVLLPEYLALEAAAAQPAAVRADLARSLAALQPRYDDFLALASELARRHGIYLLAGSFLLEVAPGRHRNRACLSAPDGALGFQDKLSLTGYELGTGLLEPGAELCVFESDFGRFAIDVCYDIEFPLYARAQAEAGARLLLVPSCTDTAAGATRVRVGCQARAMENQVYVARAVTAGAARWSPALDRNTGRAGIHGPIDRGFPASGVLAQSDATGDWAFAELDFALLDESCSRAQVAIARDWPAQQRPGVRRALVRRFAPR